MKKILASITLLSFLLTLIAVLPLSALTDQGILVNKTTFVQGEAIKVTVKGKSTDWVGISQYDKNSDTLIKIPVSSVGSGGGQFDLRAKLVSTVGELEPGKYVVALVGGGAGWFDRDGWISSVTIEITAPVPDVFLKLKNTIVKSGEPIFITAYGSGKDWVGIQKYDQIKESLCKVYVSSVGSGKEFDLRAHLGGNLSKLTPGRYIIAVVSEDSQWIDTSAWMASAVVEIVAPDPSLKVNKTSFESGEPILVTAAGDDNFWVGIGKYETNSNTLGKITIASVGSGNQFDLLAKLKEKSIVPGPGKYIIALIGNGDWADSDAWKSSVTVEIKAPVTPVPATAAPATAIPATAVPATDVPATAAPATDDPATAVPATEAAHTSEPATGVPAEPSVTDPAAGPDDPGSGGSGGTKTRKEFSTLAYVGLVAGGIAVFAIALTAGILIGKKSKQ